MNWIILTYLVLLSFLSFQLYKSKTDSFRLKESWRYFIYIPFTSAAFSMFDALDIGGGHKLALIQLSLVWIFFALSLKQLVKHFFRDEESPLE